MMVLDFIQREKTFYESRTIPLIAGDEFSQYETIRAVNFARRNKYIDENAFDDIIGDFPYDNISKYRIRLEARSTDFDFKHIEVEPIDESDEARVSAMVATKALHKKMRDIKFGKFLNKYSYIRAEYGGFIAKKTADGVHYVPWENVVTDQSDILGGPVIEKQYMSPSELKRSGWDNVDDVIRTANAKKKDKDIKDNSADEAETLGRLIEVNMLEGEVALSMLKEAQDENYAPHPDDEVEFVWARIFIAPMGKDKDGNNQGMVLKAEEITEEDFSYMYDARHPLTGRGMGEGIPEELSEHQRWHNFYRTEEARAVAIGGKVLFVTDDGEVVDTIYDEGIDHGTILKVGEGRTFNQANTMPSSVPMFQSIDESWDASADKNTNSFDAVLGEEHKSGTPFRAQFMQNLAGTSQFEQEREDMGFFIKEIVEDWLLPEALEEAAEEDNIYDSFTKKEILLIDKVIVESALTDKVVEATLEGQVLNPEMVQVLRDAMQRDLLQKGSKRKITDIREFIEKAGEKVIVNTTDEQRSKAVLFESYSNAINLFQATDPGFHALRSRILDQMGVSEEELALYVDDAMQAAEQLSPEQGGQRPPGGIQLEEQRRERNPVESAAI